MSAAAGFVILGFASLLWFVLQLRWRFLVAARAEAAMTRAREGALA